MSINSSVSPFSCHSVLNLSVHTSAHFFVYLRLTVLLYVLIFFVIFFCCNFFRSYFSSFVNSSTSPFYLLSVFRPVCSYACPFAQSPVGLYPFFCRPTFDYRSVILLVDLFVRPSISPSVSLPVNLFVLFLSSSSSALLPGYYFFCLPVLLTNRDCVRLFLCTLVRLSISLILSAWNSYVIL